MTFRDYREKNGYTPKFIAEYLGIEKDTLLAKERWGMGLVSERKFNNREIIMLQIKYKIKDLTKVEDIKKLLEN